MADWQRKLELKDIWDKYPDEMTTQQVAAVVAERLRNLTPFGDEYLDNARDELADEFQALSEDEGTNSDDFNYVMANLYDWGDINMGGAWPHKKCCWISTVI